MIGAKWSTFVKRIKWILLNHTIFNWICWRREVDTIVIVWYDVVYVLSSVWCIDVIIICRRTHPSHCMKFAMIFVVSLWQLFKWCGNDIYATKKNTIWHRHISFATSQINRLIVCCRCHRHLHHSSTLIHNNNTNNIYRTRS